MEQKKNPAKDIHRKSFMFFQIGLGISIALAITAFEWRTEVQKPKPRVVDNDYNGFVLIPITDHPNPEPPSPTPEKKEISKPNELVIISTETSETGAEIPEGAVVNPEEHTSVTTTITIPVDEPEICEDCPFLYVEEQPSPIGGYEGFYNTIRKNLKYPKQAQRMDVQGRVTVEFVVNRDGQPSDMKIIKGIGVGCDEEAMRVIALTKWNPGKQRGKPVRVKMVMPINFVME
jgi:periplasmic protein TonB